MRGFYHTKGVGGMQKIFVGVGGGVSGVRE